ncbi:DMT family transporter [Bradyrhizobium prioriisuperbiae]|uniref:DMT family transporter n=1 Tax=Bradyrhizobium prioriisuperbiae TaxID=2854389 RepID=UPI0028E2DF69|nr:DMT family transporter [Bradyrhizobium prioritasuperba]
MHIVKAVSLKIASTLMFALMGAQVRYLGGAFPVGEVAFCRALFALIPILLVFGWRGELRGALHTSRPKDHVLRGAFSIVGTFCTFGALARLPLADYTAIAFIAPLITVIFAALFLKEHVRVYRWSAVIIGFGGVILMLLPYLGNHVELTSSVLLGLAFALTNALSSGGATIQIRRLTATESTASIVVFMTLLVMLVSLLTVAFGWRWPVSWIEIVALVGVGMAGGLGQILFTDSYRYAPASFLAPFDYTAMMWAFLFGYLFFSEVPTPFVIAGAVIVAGAGLFVILRERQLGLKRSRELPVAPLVAASDDGDDEDTAASTYAKAS